ncbi:MAG TPA: ABC transporter permease [Anaerolineaceae bacterium]|nr:ABC transporter permease [Anaerolineaceae bacterium]HPN51990.1 ABC transporter permease [Anaerolineaceae bacterium]
MSIIHIASKDLMQMIRDRKTFMFLLLMPIAFTFLFGLAFNGSGQQNTDPRVPVALVNQDGGSVLSKEVETILAPSAVIRLETREKADSLEKDVAEKKLAAAVIIPEGFDAALRSGSPMKLVVIADTGTTAGTTAQTEIGKAAGRLNSSVQTALALAPEGEADFDAALNSALAAWQNPPVRLKVTQTELTPEESKTEAVSSSGFSHSSPGMILQFAIAGLLTCAQVIVSERKSRCLQRLITTSASRTQILLGHYLAIFALIFMQFVILILFGQFALGLPYLSQPLATLVISLASALCIAALGLLIGALAKGEEQAISFSLICMFLLAGLGGAWVPLEVTGETFAAIGHLSPLAWAMYGFKNVLVRGLDVSAAWLPAAALLGYAAIFFLLANWRFKYE